MVHIHSIINPFEKDTGNHADEDTRVLSFWPVIEGGFESQCRFLRDVNVRWQGEWPCNICFWQNIVILCITAIIFLLIPSSFIININYFG